MVCSLLEYNTEIYRFIFEFQNLATRKPNMFCAILKKFHPLAKFGEKNNAYNPKIFQIIFKIARSIHGSSS
jgi:hypothetical protein